MVSLQARLTADTQNFQSGSYVNWTLSNGTVAPATNTTGHPLQFSVNLQNQTVPTFYNSSWPQFTPVSVIFLLTVQRVTACLSWTRNLTGVFGFTNSFPGQCVYMPPGDTSQMWATNVQ